MYADDTTIYFNLEDFDPETLNNDINSELKKISIWLKIKKVVFEYTKNKDDGIS